jgi:DNA repair exonuclease SbcCD ATPase subunit
MTGKSTFLDGLRVHVSAPLPQDDSLREQVEARGRDLFAVGAPEIALECPGRDRTAPLHEQWPAQFFTQSELQRLSQEAGAVEEILARLAPEETPGIEERNTRLGQLDRRLDDLARKLSKLDEQVAEAEQARDRARTAKDALAAFAEAGVERLHQAGRDRQTWASSTETAEAIHGIVGEASESAARFEVPEIAGGAATALSAAGLDVAELDLQGRWRRIHERLDSAGKELVAWCADARKVVAALEAGEAQVRSAVERALAERGLDATKLKEFQELSKQAGLLPSYEANLKETRERRAGEERAFTEAREERGRLVREQREAFDRVLATIEREFGDRIRARRVDSGDAGPLDRFLQGLRQRGITRWWNDLEQGRRPSPRELLGALDAKRLHEIAMSDAVQETFRETITKARRRELEAVRNPDRYLVEMRVDDGSYRRLDDLSGGQQVSVLLSLLLETSDERPLVIDQPEDQLDNRFLFETVLPALKKLKGRRQVMVATHNANIVVNGDADLVIQLEATAHQGRVACAGAIEDPAVRDAIVRTVDGGEEAFRLRRRKYGF